MGCGWSHPQDSLDPASKCGWSVKGQVPHLTLHRLKDMLAARGVTVSHDTVWRFLRREGRSFKKNRVRQ